MKKDISPEVLAFLTNLPDIHYSKEHKGTITEEDQARIKIMLSKATDSQAQADKKALMQYILNLDEKKNVKIIDKDRKAVIRYLRKYAPEFYQLIDDLYDI